MKQVDLCERTGIGKSSISTYLSGEYEPKQRNLYKIAEALEVNVAWLMGSDDVPMEGEEKKPQGKPTSNGDLTALREQLRRQPGMRILFDASKGATEQDLKDAAALIEGFKRRRDGEE
ncbi:MAG: helix-turn-helix domain-containing protein [Desulfovibrionales bacterium]|nr:helix-turn-helix domain-containing protein [Desulfovibrionales bacterium]